MISIQKQFLFIHVPKTGGNSIQNILKDFSEDKITTDKKDQDGVERFGLHNSIYAVEKHSTLTDYRKALGKDLIGHLYKFATIRNPWDLMVSHYFSPHRGVTEWDKDDFLHLLSKVKTLRHYICSGSRISEIFKGKSSLDNEIDFLIRFEHLEDDFNRVCERLGIPAVPLPKRNASFRKHYSEYYDNELITAVENKFKEEIEFGEYNF